MPVIKRGLKQLLILSPYLLMLLVFVLNMSWNIADHDDGHTLGFHAMGRNPSIQRSYGAYDSMCDYLLGLLPINYHLLYGFMVGVTFVSAVSVIFFSSRIIACLFPFRAGLISGGILLFLIGMPEYLYMLFSYKTVSISFNFILISFYLLLKSKGKYPGLLMSSVLFGIGVSMRWNMLIYGMPIACLAFCLLYGKEKMTRVFFKTAFWGFAGILFSLIFVGLSGYPPTKIINTYLWGRSYLQESDFQLTARIGDLSLYLTPLSFVFLILGFAGLIRDHQNRFRAFLWIVSTVIPIFLIGFIPLFKYMAPLWPIFMLLFIFGLGLIQKMQTLYQKLSVIMIMACVTVNWFLGVQIDTETSNWGPGMEVKTEVANKNVFNVKKTDKRFKFEHIKIGFFDGFCWPTPEGIRPLYGHFYALFMGKSKALDEKLNRETDNVVAAASSEGKIIFIDRVNPYLLASCLRLGFFTKQPWKKVNSPFTRREFTHGKAHFYELRMNNPKGLFDLDKVYSEINQRERYYLAFTYTTALNKFINVNEKERHQKFIRLGALTAKMIPGEEPSNLGKQ